MNMRLLLLMVCAVALMPAAARCNEMLEMKMTMAIIQDNYAEVAAALDAGVDPNDKKLRPLLELFSTADQYHRPVNLKIARLLISKGADVNVSGSDGKTPLWHLCSLTVMDPWDGRGRPPKPQSWEGAVEAAQLLLDHGAKVNIKADRGSTPLMEAVRQGAADLLELLLRNGADPNATNDYGETALLWVLRADSKELAPPEKIRLAQILMAHGADPRKASDSGDTPLALAKESGSAKLVDVLQGKKVAVAVKPTGPRLENPQLALWEAASTGNLPLVIQALEQGAEVEVKDPKGRTALLVALAGFTEKCADVAKYLLDHGAQTAVSDGEGIPPLNLAIYQAAGTCNNYGKCTIPDNAFLQISEMLLKKKANVTACSSSKQQNWSWGGTPLQVAVQNLSIPVADYLMGMVNKKHLGLQCQDRTLLLSAFGSKAYLTASMTHAVASLATFVPSLQAQSDDYQKTVAEESMFGAPEGPELLAHRKDMISFLIAKGVDVNQKDKHSGVSPLTAAKINKLDDIAEILARAGAGEGKKSSKAQKK